MSIGVANTFTLVHVQVGEEHSVFDCTERFVSLTNRLDEIYECVAIYWFAEEAHRTPFQVEGLGVLWGFFP